MRIIEPSATLSKVSIITVVRNDVNGIQKTINSVKNQTYPNLEYIVIDGQSNDGTLEIVKKNSDIIYKWVSAPDNGLFDAMNKGIELATSNWLIFMNSGHVFYNTQTIADVFNSELINPHDIIYGDVAYQFKFGNIIKRASAVSTLWKGMSFSHQSTFIKTRLFKQFKYNLNYKFASDFDLFYNLYKSKYQFGYVNVVVSKRKSTGNTDSNIIKSTLERYRIVKQKEKTFEIYPYYLFLLIKYMFRKLIPRLVLEKYYQIRYSSRML